MYAVQNNVSIPRRTRATGSGRQAKYPFRFLAAGDSFAVPAKQPQRAKRVASTLSSCAHFAAKATGYKFTVRTLPNEVRVWRIA